MNTPTYDKSISALLVVDPYNDFISEGGKIWPHTVSYTHLTLPTTERV